MNFGESIKKIRKEKGFTQKQLGEKLGVSQAAIGQFESNKANPKIETIQKIADALNVTINEIIPDSHEQYMQLGLEYSVTDYGLIEVMANHKIFSNIEREKIFQKIEIHRTALSKMNDINRQLDYSRKTHDDLEDSLLKILLTKPNYNMSNAIIVLSCFLSLKTNEQSALVEILLEHCYSDMDLRYAEPPQA
ncbi:MAG: helix-turn-helix transcriptional regulator [Lachnospiraceae bacterium]|nr:helix-turn-helix transcriptional regulator [Lachnospiraceae bacterium]